MTVGSWQIIIALVLLAVTLVPAVIAFRRQHKRKWLVLLVSFFPLIGWVIALLWAILGETEGGIAEDGEAFE